MVKDLFSIPLNIYSGTLRRLIIVPGGIITSPRDGPGGRGTGFCSPGGGFFSLSRCSGLPLRLLPLEPPPGLQKPVPGPPGPPRGLVISPPGTIVSRLKVQFFDHNSDTLAWIWTRLVGNCSQESPAAF